MRFALRSLVLAAGLLAGASHVHAQVSVSDPWVRATVPQQRATGAFMQLTSPKDVKFVSASSPLTASVEVHEMAMQGDVMRMRQVPAIALGAGQTVALKPGGYHIMMMNLKAQLKEGDSVPLTLVFEYPDGKRETREIKAPVRALGHAAATGHDKARHGK
ncbi:copper chaperone PCu(A)C [Massilia sp.]|uniref:copper chaperone PCu(A)C n=1 Tax=Massilia sp. TaxID=1882437 RepID=UPI00289811E2|nr:copper chaperone PCu(A)C [Massilia sp.]